MNFVDRNQFKESTGIYGIRNIKNGKIYIGQTKENFLRRYLHHQWKLRDHSHDNPFLQEDWDEYGDKCFEFVVIELIDDYSQLDAREIYYIQYYKDLGLAYNILGGGGGRLGTPMSDHAKQILGAKNREHMLGKKHSEETKRKMSESRMNNTYFLNRSTTVLNDDIAREIKERLIKGERGKALAEAVGVSYHCVNSILSCNTWKHVQVEGWDEFQANRVKIKKHSYT